jgi:hypothetical protein
MRPTSRQLQTYKKTGKWIASEDQDRAALIRWLDLAHPNVLYKVNYGDDAKLDPRQAREQKRLSYGRGWPDVQIYERRQEFVGLAVDLKREDVSIYNSRGLFASDHIREQAEMMRLLTERGWVCGFAKGFDNQVKMITEYLSLPK